MSAQLQYIIVVIVIAGAAIMLVRHIIKSVNTGKRRDVKCADCPIAEKCKSGDKCNGSCH